MTGILHRCVTAVLLSGITATAVHAQPTTFRISQLYSNLDGSVQFVELTESAGMNGQHRLKGLTLISRGNGVVKRFRLNRDLPDEKTANVSIVVATSWLFIVDDTALPPDILGLPGRFLPTNGGTVEFAGVDAMTYAALPTNGTGALYREGAVAHATFPSNARCPAAPPCGARFMLDQSEVYAIEYHHRDRGHYFLTASAPEIDALDAGRLAGWERTGHSMHVGGGEIAPFGLDQPVCRLYIPPGDGDSHFFSASVEECAEARRRLPRLVLETDSAFLARLPDLVTGECGEAHWPGHRNVWVQPFPLYPVFRLWNGRVDSNHRYTTSFELREQMLTLGYQSEGYGPRGVAMCVLPQTPWDY